MKMRKPNKTSDTVPSEATRTRLQVYTVTTPEAKKDFDAQLEDGHYLGGECQGGDYLRQIVYRHGEPVALFAWGSACYALKARDEYIGWLPSQRAERQKLLVQNRRFLLLCERGEEPNLASQALGAVVRALPQQWLEHFQYAPLLAETFTDMESFHGTCYKAAGWVPVGITKGYSRHRASFFTRNGEPKKTWLKPLAKEACKKLCAEQLPPECERGAHSNAHGVMPITQPQIVSLQRALRRVPDPRRYNKKYSASAVLSIVVMAQLTGKVQLYEIHRFGTRLKQPQRKNLGLPLKKGTKVHQVPGYSVYRDLLQAIDPDQLALVLNEWLASEQGQLPGHLAFDGKMIGDTAGVLTLVDTETGVARAMIPMRHKEEGPDGEITRAQELLDQIPDLSHQSLSADALHTQKKTAVGIVEKGGEFTLQVKANQPGLLKLAQDKTDHLPPFLPTPKKHTGG